MKTDAEYTYLLTDTDLSRIQDLISMLEDAVTNLFQHRKLVPTDELDNDPDLAEMCYCEMSCKITENSSDPRPRRP